MGPTYSIDEIADRTRLTRSQVMHRMRSPNPWPHCRPNQRDARTWYFTDSDVEAIDELIRHRGIKVDSWGRERRSRR